MNDPKYAIVDGKLWHVGPGGPDYQIPDDEPIMVLRGKDPFAPAVIAEYILRHKCPDHQESACERLLAFRRYQTDHPDRVSVNCTGTRFYGPAGDPGG